MHMALHIALGRCSVYERGSAAIHAVIEWCLLLCMAGDAGPSSGSKTDTVYNRLQLEVLKVPELQVRGYAFTLWPSAHQSLLAT